MSVHTGDAVTEVESHSGKDLGNVSTEDLHNAATCIFKLNTFKY